MLKHASNKKIRVILMGTLHHAPENKALLLEMAASEKGNCKKAVMSALVYMEGEDVEEYWKKAVKKNASVAWNYLIKSEANWLSDLVAQKLIALLDGFLNSSGEVETEDEDEFVNWFSAAHGKHSEDMKAFFQKAAENSQCLLSLTRPEKEPISRMLTGSSSIKGHICGLLGSLLANTLLRCNPEGWCEMAIGNFKKWPNEVTAEPAFAAALMTKSASEVYELFMPLLAQGPLLQKAENENQRSEFHSSGCFALVNLLGRTEYIAAQKEFVIHSVCYNFEETILGDESGFCQRPLADRLDAGMVDYLRKNEE